MKGKGYNAPNKFMILKHASQDNNVSETCRLFGISRTTYYNWRTAYQKMGMAGLEINEPRKPQMPNKVPKALEQEILAYVQRHPADGPQRIYYDLKAEGFQLGISGIYNVLRRHKLSKKAQRIEYSRSKEPRNRTNQLNKKFAPANKELREAYPGYLVLQRVSFIGTFTNIGKIYQYTIFDAYSKWGFAKLFNHKEDLDVWRFFELKLVYFLKILNLSVENLITEKTPEFMPYILKNNQHENITKKYAINHIFMAREKNNMWAGINDFNNFLGKEFYDKITSQKDMDSFAKVERSLQQFLLHYNSSWVISSGFHKGKVPNEVILKKAAQNHADLDALPLWLLIQLNIKERGQTHV